MEHDDIALWPCGTWCYGDEVCEFTHKSDDYEVIKGDSADWWKISGCAQSPAQPADPTASGALN